MQRDSRAYLWDAREAADAIIRFTQDRPQQEFEEDPEKSQPARCVWILVR